MEWSRAWGSRRRQGKRRDFGAAGSSADGVELEELGASGAGRANNDEDAGEARAACGAAAAGRRPPVRGWVPSALGQRRGWIDGFGSLGGGLLGGDPEVGDECGGRSEERRVGKECRN